MPQNIYGIDLRVGCKPAIVPDILRGLNSLENRMIARRILFARIRKLVRIRLPNTGQFAFVKNVVNVPVSANE